MKTPVLKLKRRLNALLRRGVPWLKLCDDCGNEAVQQAIFSRQVKQLIAMLEMNRKPARSDRC